MEQIKNCVKINPTPNLKPIIRKFLIVTPCLIPITLYCMNDFIEYSNKVNLQKNMPSLFTEITNIFNECTNKMFIQINNKINDDINNFANLIVRWDGYFIFEYK